MKSVLVTMGAFLIVGSAQASTLKCWDTYAKRGARPTLVAEIESDNSISDVRFNQRANADEPNTDFVPERGPIEGTLITTNRSPYKGKQDFMLKNLRLILPAQLDNESLDADVKSGENGVLIGNYAGGSDGGSHYSIRLRCRAY